jgi:hypothetical protein
VARSPSGDRSFAHPIMGRMTTRATSPDGPSMGHMTTLTIPWAQRRAISVKAGCDPRTLEKVIRGEAVKNHAVAQRAFATLKEAGFEPPPLARWVAPARGAA